MRKKPGVFTRHIPTTWAWLGSLPDWRNAPLNWPVSSNETPIFSKDVGGTAAIAILIIRFVSPVAGEETIPVTRRG
jgi:hypothetical protein